MINTVSELGLELELAPSDLPHIKLVSLDLELVPSDLWLVPPTSFK